VPERKSSPEYALEGCVLRKHVEEFLTGYRVSFRHFFLPPTGPSRAQPVNLG